MFESIRWPGDPFCPFCGALDHITQLGGKSMGPGWYWCSACRYIRPGRRFAKHETVQHSAGEYVRGDTHTNTVEGYFSIFKRGMKGIYQHRGEKHLHRYLAEFDFRYSNRLALGIHDAERSTRAIRGAEGKRLTYRPPVNGQGTEAGTA
jgi:ISXO2-like transposase domain/Transposase zinc-ribbon domain